MHAQAAVVVSPPLVEAHLHVVCVKPDHSSPFAGDFRSGDSGGFIGRRDPEGQGHHRQFAVASFVAGVNVRRRMAIAG